MHVYLHLRIQISAFKERNTLKTLYVQCKHCLNTIPASQPSAIQLQNVKQKSVYFTAKRW